ncbi:hypothetical protein [Polaromonas sp.]|uniref:hypothetical protein n=1 Tax=Polaromonas sp. TaxID=1869339 RepID=UPI003CC5C448
MPVRFLVATVVAIVAKTAGGSMLTAERFVVATTAGFGLVKKEDARTRWARAARF